MTPERLAEIQRHDVDNEPRLTAQFHRRELLAEVQRLTDELDAERKQFETEWAICVEEPGQVPVLAVIDTEDNARAGAVTTRANVGRRAVVSVRSRLVGPWRNTAPTAQRAAS